MNQSNFTEIIKEQARRSLWNIHNVVDCVSDEYWSKNYCEMPLWKHIYHTIHSLDKWYINPEKYAEPLLHSENLNNLDVKTIKTLSKDEIKTYLKGVEEKINQYLENLTDEVLLTKPEYCDWTVFTLILAQHRHLDCHTGIIMGLIIAETKLWPRVVGLENDIPKDGYRLYF